MAKEIRVDQIPYQAGVVRVTPLDKNGTPIYAKSYTTFRNFMVSTQVSEGRTTESVANGNGQDAEYPTGANYNLAVAVNVYDPKFHAIISGVELAPTAAPIMIDTTVTPGEDGTFTFAKNVPVKANATDKAPFIEIKDSYGNIFTDISGATETPALGELNFKFEDSSHKLTFDSRYKGVMLNCIYYYADETAETYAAPATPQTHTFLLETLGETQSADTGEIIRVYQKVTRGVVSGDLPNVTTQKQKQNTITYNFKSAPTPIGVTPFEQTFATVKDIPSTSVQSVPAQAKNK